MDTASEERLFLVNHTGGIQLNIESQKETGETVAQQRDTKRANKNKLGTIISTYEYILNSAYTRVFWFMIRAHAKYIIIMLPLCQLCGDLYEYDVCFSVRMVSVSYYYFYCY